MEKGSQETHRREYQESKEENCRLEWESQGKDRKQLGENTMECRE